MIVEKVDEYVEKQRKVFPCHTNRASSMGHECARYLTYCRTNWEDKSLVPVTLQYIFMGGQDEEDNAMDWIRKSGVRIYEPQKSFHWKEYNISGHLDFTLSQVLSLGPV